MKLVTSIICLFSFSALAPCFAHDSESSGPGIPNFHTVTSSIDRGARPSAKGIKWLAHTHVATDIDLENDESAISDERKMAKDEGIRFLSFPMDSGETPSDETVNEALSAIASSANEPVFVHCHHGEDRTGLIIGLYRIRHEGWTAKQAYSEMLKYGFSASAHAELLKYFEKVTGFHPSNEE